MSGDCHSAVLLTGRCICCCWSYRNCCLSVAAADLRRKLQQAPWEEVPAPATYLPLKSNDTVKVSSSFDTRSPENVGQYDLLFEDDYVSGAQVRAQARYPDPRTENPLGWRFKTVANSSLVFTYPANRTTEELKLRNIATSDSKLAPAVALAGTYAEMKRYGYCTLETCKCFVRSLFDP